MSAEFMRQSVCVLMHAEHWLQQRERAKALPFGVGGERAGADGQPAKN
jgi:hypothetical protein